MGTILTGTVGDGDKCSSPRSPLVDISTVHEILQAFKQQLFPEMLLNQPVVFYVA